MDRGLNQRKLIGIELFKKLVMKIIINAAIKQLISLQTKHSTIQSTQSNGL
jgi:hypothetical protein